ncbi:hypothetical protein BJ944DRAFT_45137 [Cunninghamella echinulata]|nr:hypothetical protein BJ944DRAFT_45137 [Cunninghamella echinulata]
MTSSPVENKPNINSIVPAIPTSSINNSEDASVQTNSNSKGTTSISKAPYQLPPLTISNITNPLSSSYALGPTSSKSRNDHNYRNSTTVSPQSPFNNGNTGQRSIPEPISNNGSPNYNDSTTQRSPSFSSIPTRSTLSSYNANNTNNNTLDKENHNNNNIPPPPPTSSDNSTSNGCRPLNVKDALSYLDQVKIRFGDRPEVYNQFLDIMKDFKSQTIDTPGVIERVSTLFHGHPNLTSGFNAFLPPGYNISTDPHNPDLIRVTTPTGTMTTSTTAATTNQNNTNNIYNSQPHRLPHPLLNKPPHSNSIYHSSNYHTPPPPHPPLTSGVPHPLPLPPHSVHQPHQYSHSIYQYQTQQPLSVLNETNNVVDDRKILNNSNSMSPLHHHQHHQQQQYHTQYQYSQQHNANTDTNTNNNSSSQIKQYYNQHSTNELQNSQQPPMSNQSSSPSCPPHSVNNKSPVKGKRPTVDFNNAINYVNKIKNRFAEDSDIYKQFLELLQTYQKEEHKIEEVYSQVHQLFIGHPDLLEEFQQFLPEVTEIGHSNKRPLPYTSALTSPLPAGKKKRQGLKRNKNNMDSNNFDDNINSNNNDKYTKRSGYSSIHQGFDPNNPMVSSEEIELFDHINKHIGNKPSYEVFLKLLNLYSQNIIELEELVKRVDVFLGNKPELMVWFKAVIGYEHSSTASSTIERPNTPVIPKPDLVRCETVSDSPSYRRVPKEWEYQPCSGRDSLCWEVLNDKYASHPIWASEDSAFATSKKNPYEEAMHRCEEERYEYDVNIEANLHTIAFLEPIIKDLENLTIEEQERYTFPSGLGGQTMSIYERALKKIYGPDRGPEVIQMLYAEPARAVPIIMKRLKQKDEEWTKGQREWNKIWREMDEKNYYKSLDYQGLTFKSSERKTVTNRYLINEIESLYRHDEEEDDINEKARSTAKNHEQSILSPKSKVETPHLSYQISDDVEIIDDIFFLICSYMEHQNGFSSNDKERVRSFFKSFVPTFFSVKHDLALLNKDSHDHKQQQQQHQYSSKSNKIDKNDEDNDDENKTPISSSSDDYIDEDRQISPQKKQQKLKLSNSQSSSIIHINATNILDTKENSFNVNLEKGEEKEDIKTNEKETISDKMETTDNELEDSTKTVLSEKKKHSTVQLLETASEMTTPKFCNRIINTLYGNSYFYCFLRLFETIYSRLSKMKLISENIMKNPNLYSTNKTAEKLGLKSNRFEDVDLSQGNYKALLEQIDRYFDSDMDAATFEETTRYLFTTEAYVLFNIDKLIQTIIKQIQTLATDEKSVDLLTLYQDNQRTANNFIYNSLSVYRTHAENIIGYGEHFFRISYNKKNHQLLMFLLDYDEDIPDQEEAYEDYLKNMMTWKVVQNPKLGATRPSFLKRNLQIRRNQLDDVMIDNKLHYMIHRENYRLSYQPNTEYFFYRAIPLTTTSNDKNNNKNVSLTSSEWERLLYLKKKMDKRNELEKMEIDARQLLIGIK